MKYIKYHNCLNSINLSSLSVEENNLLFGLLYSISNQRYTYELDEISTLRPVNFRDYFVNEKSESMMLKKISLFEKKIKSINEYVELPNGDIKRFNIFNNFFINYIRKTVTIERDIEFLFITNDLNKDFTTFDLDIFLQIDCSYCKTLYRKIIEINLKGYKEYKINIVSFLEMLGISLEEVETTCYVEELLEKIKINLSKYIKGFNAYLDKKDNEITFFWFGFYTFNFSSKSLISGNSKLNDFFKKRKELLSAYIMSEPSISMVLKLQIQREIVKAETIKELNSIENSFL